MSSVKNYILDEIKKKSNDGIRSFFYDYYSDKELRNPETSLVKHTVDLVPSDAEAFSYLETADYGYTLMVDPAKDTKGILKAYYIPRAQPHLISFLEAQNKYLQNIQARLKEALIAYTYHGDRFINGFLRNTLNQYEFVQNTNSENEYAFKKRYTFINLINSVRSSGICPFKYAIKERYPDLRNILKELPVMILHTNINYMDKKWIEVGKGEIEFPPLSFSLDDDEAFQKIMQSSWFNSVENVSTLVESLLTDLIKVFIESPRPTKDITVYRGVKSNHIKTGTITSTDFWSTSLSPWVSLSFATYLGKNVNFMLEEITIKANVPCLFISQYSKVGPGEWEILLPPGVNYSVDDSIYIKSMPRLLDEDEDILFTPDTYIEHMTRNKSKKSYILVNTIRANSFNPSIPFIKKVFNAVRLRKSVLNQRRILRHLPNWQPKQFLSKHSTIRNPNRIKNRNISRRRYREDKRQKYENEENNYSAASAIF
jgi:hypothetical protein